MPKPKKSKKKGGSKKGRKASKAKSSSAKRGAKRTTLRAGMIVSKKPNKRTLKSNGLKVKKIGTVGGKPAYKVMKKAKRTSPLKGMSGIGPFANAARYEKVLVAQKKKEEADLKKRWRAVINLRKRAEKLGLTAEVDANAAMATQLQAQIAAVQAQKAAAERDLEAAREESRTARQAYED